jgi:hypothetical protein
MIGTNRNISGFDPRNLAKCCLWLDGADPKTMFSDVAGTTNSTLNGAIALWKDKSDSRANVSNATSAQQPVYTSAGVSYYSLSNSGKGLFGVPPIFSSGAVSAFVVFNPTSLTSGEYGGRKVVFQLYAPAGCYTHVYTDQYRLGMTDGNGEQYARPIVGVNNLVSLVSYNKSLPNLAYPITQLGWDLNCRLSSTSWTYKGFGNSTGNGFSIGTQFNAIIYSFDGTISELIIYDSFLTDEQKKVVQRYLSQKWNTSSQPFNPLSIPNCVLWNNASTLTGTGTVGTWSNPAGATTVACGGTKTPNGRNGLMTVRLTTAQTWIPSPDIALPAYTLFWSGRQTGGYFGNNRRVLQGTANNHLYGYWGNQKRVLYHNAYPGFLSGAPADTEWDIFSTSRIADNGYTFSWNGSLLYEGYPSTGSWMDGLRINSGASPEETSDCEIGEIILYNRYLNTDETKLVERYLICKWNNTLTLPLNFPLDTVTPRLRVFQPTDFRDCYCWIDAVQDTSNVGSTVSTVRDWTGNAPSIAPLSPGTITLQANGLNGRPVYNFGTSRAMSAPTFTWNSSFTQFAVVQSANGNWIAANLVNANNNYYNYSFAGNWFLYTDSAMVLTDTSVPSGVNGRSIFENASGGKSSWVIFCIGHQSGDSNLNNYTVNGIPLTSSTSNMGSALTNVGKLMLNGNGDGAFDTSSVAEFIHYNRSLSQGERQEVEGYLSQKWNIPLPIQTTFSPSNVPGCQLWLDASDSNSTTLSGSSVTVWNDKSGNNRHMNTITPAATWTPSTAELPIIGTPIGGLRTINFKAQSGIKQATTLDGVKNLFWVGRIAAPVGTPGANCSFLLGHDVNYDWHGTPFPGKFLNTTFANAGIQSASPVSLFAQGATPVRQATFSNVDMPADSVVSLLSVAGITGTTRYQGLCYDRNGGHIGWCGDLAEVIIYSNALTTEQRSQVENYLLEKWKISNHPYKTLPTAVSSTFVPSTLSRCQLWLDGADPAGTGVRPAANSTVSTWVDKSGNMNNGTASGTPTFLVEGGINFTGGPYFLNQNFKMTFANRSIFIVMQETTRTNAGVFTLIPTPSNQHDYGVPSGFTYNCEGGFQPFGYWYGGPVGYTYRMGNTTLLPRAIYNDNINTVVGSGFVNGSNAANKTAIYSATTCSGYVVAGRWYQDQGVPTGGKLNGVIYEIIAYDRGLTTPERQQVEGYLAWKWNINSSLPTTHPFYKVSPGPSLRSIMLNQDELYLWLDASDLSTLFQNPVGITPVTANGQGVGVWYDKSGKQRHYSAQFGTYPTYSTKSQVPEVEFNANQKLLGCRWLPPGCIGLDFFIVTQPLTSTGDWRTLFRGYNNDHHVIIQQGSYNLGAYYNQVFGFQQYGSGTLDGTRRVIIHVSISLQFVQSGSITQLGQDYDGTTVMSVAGGTNANDNIYYLGGYQGGSQPWGNVSEILVFQRNLTNPEKLEVYNYLNAKWFTRVTLNNAIDYLPLASNATNLGTSGNAVTTMGNVVYNSSTGKAAAYFNDTYSLSQYLILPYTNPEKFTFCFWLYAIDGYYYTAISLTTAALNSYIIALQVDTAVNGYGNGLRVYTAMPDQWTNQPTGSFSVQQWTHYAVTINQITFVEQLYVNGVLADTRTGSGSSLSRTDRFVLGRSGDNSRGFWGYIRQFAVFNTILTPYEVRDIYLATV